MKETIFETYGRWVAAKSMFHDASHDWIHIQNVVHNAETIMSSLKLDASTKEITLYTAVSHELCDKKYVSNATESLDDMKTFMHTLNISPHTIECVARVVPCISFSQRLATGEPEFEFEEERIAYWIVSDADMLESLGATGIVRTFMYQAYNGYKTAEAYNHCKTRLFKCINYMHYPYSKTEGAERLARMKRICDELQNEREFV